jgi:rhamnulokinase
MSGSAEKVYLAIDLGASSGRVTAGLFDGKRVRFEEVHRFFNGGILANERLHWGALTLWSNILEGMRLAHRKYGERVVSLGVDTWGVDFALLDRDDDMLSEPFHYRDARTKGILPDAFKIRSREEIFAETGLQFLEFNTLYQLFAMKRANSVLLESARTFLMMPDLFHFWMTGEKVNEVTDASTTQLYNPLSQSWSAELLQAFDLPGDMLCELAQPGAKLGKLRPSVVNETGLANATVVIPGSHDTASAVLAAPAASAPGAIPNWAFLSSGTWSLMGVEMPHPVVDDQCLKLNFTNEAGVGGTTRLLKNIGGLWLVQECRRVWGNAGIDLSWDELVARAMESPALRSFVDPDAPRFTAPWNMPEEIQAYCRETGQEPPEHRGEMIRCILESLALRYRMALTMLESLVGKRLETIHIVGGGCLNEALCQMTADACGRRVLAGPVEATALGVVMVQAIADGSFASIAQAREVIRRSFDVKEYLPGPADPWDQAYGRFEALLARGVR